MRILATIALFFAATVASAQSSRPIELGMDGGFSWRGGASCVITEEFCYENETNLEFPIAAMRVGFYHSSKISIEPALSLTFSGGDGSTFASLNTSVGLLYHLGANPQGLGMYVRPFAGFYGVAGDGFTDIDPVFGIGVGVKRALIPQWATRFEVSYQNTLGDHSSNNPHTIALTAGLSYFPNTASAAGTARRMEAGADAELLLSDQTGKIITKLSLPNGLVRLGFFLNDRLSIEPNVGFNRLDYGFGTITRLSVDVGALHHFGSAGDGRGAYVRPFVGTVFARGDNAHTDYRLGAGLGIKVPWRSRIAGRFEAGYAREGGDYSFNAFTLNAGISVFTK